MAAPADIRVVQLTRMLGPGISLDASHPSRALRAHTRALAHAFLSEAADNDDVISTEAARDYLAGRLRFFSGLIDHETATAVRAAFDEGLRSWDA